MNIESEIIFDEDALATLHEMLEEEFIDVVEMFIEIMPEQIERLIKSNIEGDLQSVEKITHNIKGASGNIAAINLSDICDVLETGLRENSIDDATDHVDAIESSFNRTISELKKRFGGEEVLLSTKK